MQTSIRAETDILPWAVENARRFGDPNPSLIQHTTTTRRDAEGLLGSITCDDTPVYLVAMRGRFSVIKPTRGATSQDTLIAVPVLIRVIEIETGRIVVSGSRHAYPDLERVGRVITDFEHEAPRHAPKA